MSEYLLLIPILLPILGAILVRNLRVSGHVKEILNLILVSVTAIFTLVVVIIPPEKMLCFFGLNEALTMFLKVDGLGRIFAGMVSVLWPFAYLYTMGYMEHDDKHKNYAMFYVITFGVVLGISLAGNLVTLYFFYEMLTLVTIPLINQPKTREAKRASRYYVYVSLLGSTLALVGIVILLTYFGSGNFGVIFDPNNFTGNKDAIYIAYILLFLGFGVKAAIFPFYFWLPMAGAAPTPTTALLHAVAVVKAGSFAIIRVIYSVIGTPMLYGSVVQIITMMIAAFTIIFGSVMALKQVHLKRRFAYSTISNISYILLAATMMNKLGLYAAILHLIFHSFAKISIFFVAGGLMHNGKITYIDQINGLGKKMPITFIAYTIAGLSIVGIPLFAGFISKWEIANAAISVNTWYSFIGIIALLISALLTAIYVLDITIRAFALKPNTYNQENYDCAHECNYKFLVPICTFAFLSLFLGIFGNPLLKVIASLLEGGL